MPYLRERACMVSSALFISTMGCYPVLLFVQDINCAELRSMLAMWPGLPVEEAHLGVTQAITLSLAFLFSGA